MYFGGEIRLASSEQSQTAKKERLDEASLVERVCVRVLARCGKDAELGTQTRCRGHGTFLDVRWDGEVSHE